MNDSSLPLILSLVSLLLGGGSLIKLFLAGRKFGSLEEKISTLEESRKQIAGLLPKLEVFQSTLGHCKTLCKRDLELVQNANSTLQDTVQEYNKCIHHRVDNMVTELNKIAAFENGMKTVSEQIAGLLSEVRSLLKTGVITTAHGKRLDIIEREIKNIGSELAELRGRFAAHDHNTDHGRR